MVFSSASLSLILPVGIITAIAFRIFQNLYLHPLSKFPGPWYAASFSLSSAIISLRRREPEWLLSLAEQYGTDQPIRIAPMLLLFPRASALKDIYWDSKTNQKSGLYGTGVLGPPHLFTTLDGNEHKALRKALGGPQWSVGALKKTWEPRIDELVQMLVQKLSAAGNTTVVLSDKVAGFAADVMTMLSFSEPWGFIKNDRDERHILRSWREGLNFFGFVGRFRWFRETVLKSPLAVYLLPKMSDQSGMGYLISQADRQVTMREGRVKEDGLQPEKPDYLQYTLEARINSKPLSPAQRRAHVTLLIQAGADTTGTGMGSTLRFVLMHPACLAACQAEIQAADAANLLTHPVQYEETRQHLPYTVACIKESLRLNPPATNLFARVTPPKGIMIDGTFVPGGVEITSNAYVVQRDPGLYGPDPKAFRPERWLESEEKAAEMDAASFVFGMGPRVCLGKDIAIMELYKVFPELVRQFDMDLVDPGTYVVAGGVAYNQGLKVKLSPRVPE